MVPYYFIGYGNFSPGVWQQLYSSPGQLLGMNTTVSLSTLIKKKIEIQNGAVAKSYMTDGLLIYGEIFPHFLMLGILSS